MTTYAATPTLPLFGTGVLATVAASVATPIVAAAATVVGISLDIGGAPIPVLGFGTLTAFFSLVGVVMAVAMARFARRPRSTFVRTTVVLTALSLVPDVIAPAAPTTKALLMLTHLVAAAIVDPRRRPQARLREEETAVQYMLAVHAVDGAPQPSPEEMQTAFAQVDRVNAELQSAGAWVFGGGLLAPETATVVRVQGGATTMTDGPFAETKEQLGGFWVIQCKDLDEALAWAEKCAEACMNPVEVRPFAEVWRPWTWRPSTGRSTAAAWPR